MPVNTTIKLRRGSTTEWTTGGTKSLAEGEIAVDTTTGKLKVGGAGGTTWAASTNIAVIQADYATYISGGGAGQIPYQTGAGVTAFLSATSSANKTLVSTGTAPSWVFPTLSSTYFSTTTSLQLQGVVTDAVGLSSGAKLVFNDSPVLTTPNISSGGALFAQPSGSFKTTLTPAVSVADIAVTLPTTAGTLALTTVTNSFLKADGTVQGSANPYMTGTLAVGASGFSVTTAGNLATAGTVTFTHSSLKSTGNAVVKVDPATGVVSAGLVALADSTNVSGVLPVANGGLGVATGTTVLPTGSTSGVGPARSVLRIFVQSAQPASGNITGYTPAVGDLWFW